MCVCVYARSRVYVCTTRGITIYLFQLRLPPPVIASLTLASLLLSRNLLGRIRVERARHLYIISVESATGRIIRRYTALKVDGYKGRISNLATSIRLLLLLLLLYLDFSVRCCNRIPRPPLFTRSARRKAAARIYSWRTLEN